MKRIVLTGANGFIGRQTIPRLQKIGYEVHALYHLRKPDLEQNCYWHSCDLFDVAQQKVILQEIMPTHLLHFAWNVDHKTYLASPDNLDWVEASFNLLKHFNEVGGKRAVFAGTCFEYDLDAGRSLAENASLKAASLYARCKIHLQERMYDTASRLLPPGFYLFDSPVASRDHRQRHRLSDRHR